MKKKLIIFGSLFLAIVLVLSFPILQILWLDNTTQTHLRVENNTLFMSGTINSKTPHQLQNIFNKYPAINTVVMETVEGSVNDEANLEAATWISQKDLTFILEENSLVASGGTDFFLAGEQRIVHPNAQVGVHSWSDGINEASSFIKGSKEHEKYIDYYMAIGWPKESAEKFYYFTIYAAPADGMHWMTPEEIKEYNITTQN